MEQVITPGSVSRKYGLIVGLIGIIITAIVYMVIGDSQSPVAWLTSVVLIVGIVLAHNEFKKMGDGFMSFGQGFRIGFMISFISGVLQSVFSYIYLAFIDESFLREQREAMIIAMEDQGVGTDNPMFSMMESFASPGAIAIFGIIGSAFGGLILGLIISAITKKDRPEFGM